MKLEVDALDAAGRGVARNAGKVVFVEGALPGERAEVEVFAGKRSFDVGKAGRILQPSPHRAMPRCPHFRVCGGRGLQHSHAARYPV